MLNRPTSPYRPIADYGLIGDTHGVALVSSDGSIDWCALPDVDGPAFLLRLLDARQGGSFQIRPTARRVLAERRYVADTNVIETTFRTDTGAVRLLDGFISSPDREPSLVSGSTGPRQLVRVLEGLDGQVEVELSCQVTPDFARQSALAHQQSAHAVGWRWEDGAVWLEGSWPLQLRDATAAARETLRAGERLACVLSDSEPTGRSTDMIAAELEDTMEYWRSWARRCQYEGPYRGAVVRSALTLKLLTYAPSGAIVAAPTTSLPEEIGGERNWDYRFCWLRDATYTLYALGLLGYLDEARDFMRWIQTVCMACGTALQIVYGVRGERDLAEHALGHLSGYRGSRPVRIGNAASRQRQLDIFGEVLDSAYLFFHKWGGLERYSQPLAGPMWELLRSLADEVVARWSEPDSGIWEVRGGPRHFLHSKAMAWVALDRGLRLAEAYSLPGDLARWREERDQLRREILQRGYSERVGAFTQAFDSDALDASALLLPLVGFIDVRDPRMVGTIRAIQERLTRDGLVYRYLADDGLPGGEGAFCICTFWLIDCLTFAGRLDEARALFEAMLRRANPLGLYAEEIDPSTGQFLGNFPQGFTHVALINAAVNLTKAGRRQAPANRAAHEPQPPGPLPTSRRLASPLSQIRRLFPR